MCTGEIDVDRKIVEAEGLVEVFENLPGMLTETVSQVGIKSIDVTLVYIQRFLLSWVALSELSNLIAVVATEEFYQSVGGFVVCSFHRDLWRLHNTPAGV